MVSHLQQIDMSEPGITIKCANTSRSVDCRAILRLDLGAGRISKRREESASRMDLNFILAK
jgi:hypothetical protein